MINTVLFVDNENGFINQAITINLTNEGFTVIDCLDDPNSIKSNQKDAEIILYNMVATKPQIERKVKNIINAGREYKKTICLIADEPTLKEIKLIPEASRINLLFKRPIDIRRLVHGIKELSSINREYDRPKSLLLVDDDIDFLNIATGMLHDNYIVASVRSGKEALRYLENFRPDMILLDYEMPGMNGVELMSHIRRKPMFDNVPVIFFSGKSDRNVVTSIVEQRPDGYLLKSLKKEQLIEQLGQIFADNILTKKTFMMDAK